SPSRPRVAPQSRTAAAFGVGRSVVAGFSRNDLLTYASAISFKILTAAVPFFLFVFALAGLLHLDGLWRQHLAPDLRTHVSTGFYRLISDAVGKAFGSKQVLWASLGGVLALWQVSGAVRAVMGAFGKIYNAPTDRTFARRYLISAALAIAVGACFVLAAVSAILAPFFTVAHPPPGWRVAVFLVRWTLAALILLVAVGLLMRVAPATPMPLPWVSLGAGLVMACWLAASLLFYVYLTKLASYESVFGGLASVIVAMAYLYISVTVFLFGAQIDAIARQRSTGKGPAATA
ncbi:MAG: YihY/virulence factor BrkB family protein, partial [Candidatus Dormibacteraeota bacterium]|nr:YihY/virulence factor BrkB family protein [Candidatus Dormibacteraeota bacterium]